MTLAVAALTAGCGADETDVSASDDAPAGEDPRAVYAVTATVLEDDAHGPHLCDTVQDSYPPQCSGHEIVGWDWAEVDDETSANGTTWGSYRVVGTWDGTRLTLTEPPGPPVHDDEDGGGFDVDFATPCPAPDGGWQVVDPATTSLDAQDQLGAMIQAHPDAAGLWVDQSINPALTDGVLDPGDERVANDPTLLVVNIRTTGDVDAMTAEARAIWGGALCVTTVEHRMSELQAIQAQLTPPEVMRSLIDVVGNVVDVLVPVADDATVAELTERFGTAVRVEGWLQPA